MKKRFLVLLTIGLFVFPLIIYAVNAPTKDIQFKGKKGTVTFSHTIHTKKVADCKTCHHKGEKSEKCHNCHEGKDAKKVFHKKCKGCHKSKKAGPTKCKDCHKK